MKEFINIYQEHKDEIENFLITTLKNNGELLAEEEHDFNEIFNTFPSLELIYIADEDFFQTSPNIFRNKKNDTAKGKNRNYLHSKIHQKDEEFGITTPYISSASGRMCITVLKHEDYSHIFMDFSLVTLLSRLGLIELHPTFNDFTKLFYKAVGFALMAFAFFSIGYAVFGYVSHIFVDKDFSLEGLFKPIVALTLGLAIFDLAKTILEREVFFKNYTKETEDAKVLTKFSIAIIIALSIEALMVVFKIALHDYSQMVHALYLIAGISLIILSLGIYSYLSKKAAEK